MLLDRSILHRKEDGQLLVSISKDNMLRVFDPRVGSSPIKVTAFDLSLEIAFESNR